MNQAIKIGTMLNIFISQISVIKYQTFKVEMEGHVVIYTYLYQMRPFNSDYYLEDSTTLELYLLCNNISITNLEVPVLSPTTTNWSIVPYST